MDFKKENYKKMLGLIAFGVILYWALQRISSVAAAFQTLLGFLAPFLLGLCIAFLLNVLLTLLEEKLFARLNQKQGRVWPRVRRPVCILLSIGIVAGVIFILLFLILPELKRTGLIIANRLPDFMEDMQEKIPLFLESLKIPADFEIPLTFDWDKISKMISDFLQNGGKALFNTTLDITTSIFSTTFNIVLGLVFSIYILMQKENLFVQFKRLLYAYIPERRAQTVLEVCTLSNHVFSRFVTGQLTEALIIGLLCFGGMTVFGMPYAMVVSVLVGFTALIPVFGAFIGTGVGAFLILMVNPVKAFWFIVFIIVLQQLEGNLIYPKVVGKSIGLPGMWVLMAVTIGGSAFGILGMLLGVPLCSIVYTLIQASVGKRLQQKEMEIT